ncbi:MAG: hypothetical protein RLN69_06940, partial [Woeseiaceae bacterium]
MNIDKCVYFLAWMLLLVASPLALSDESDIRAQLKACSLKADRTDRLDCFDDLNRKVNSPPESPVVAATATPSMEPAPNSEPDEAESG